MNWITVNQFLNQPKKVQETLKKWWKPNHLDYFYDTENEFDSVVILMENVKFPKELAIPLFTETQLRKFIEEKNKLQNINRL